MSGKIPEYKYCPFSKSKIPVEAIICLACETEQLKGDGSDDDGIIGGRVLQSSLTPYYALMQELTG